jgi:D-alanine-D-alanine ligase
VEARVKVALLHQQLPADASKDEMDVLDQVETVLVSLNELGYETIVLAVSLDLSRTARELNRIKPDLVFNLVEAMAGSGRLIHVVPALLDVLHMSYSGCATEALFTTSNKLLAKTLMEGSDLATPRWLPASLIKPGLTGMLTGSWIVKSVWEHASIGLSDDSIISSERDLLACFQALEPSVRLDFFAEEYIPGREFNLSILAARDGPEVLPPAEILFVDYPPGKARIVDYRAKWEVDSFEYGHTVRSFDFPPGDSGLIARLKTLAARCWEVFGLRGYARVDFRVDGAGRPWILEINANPCISPEAGFLTACEQAGLTRVAAVERIVFDSMKGSLP